MKVCAIAAESGHTKDLQFIQLKRGLHIIDLPGVIFDDDDHIQGQKESSMLLCNIMKSEDVDDPISVPEVMQLIGYISEHTAYHHSEQSLTMTIVNLVQDYIRSNNLNLLLPNGQDGTHNQSSKNHASVRYIFTKPSSLSQLRSCAQSSTQLTTLA
jgi:ribosome biogenesis GTPase A